VTRSNADHIRRLEELKRRLGPGSESLADEYADLDDAGLDAIAAAGILAGLETADRIGVRCYEAADPADQDRINGAMVEAAEEMADRLRARSITNMKG
jgi:hypothetical protein